MLGQDVVGGVGVVVGDVGDGVGCVGSLVGVDGEGLVGSDGRAGSVVGVVGFDVVGCDGSLVGVVGSVLGSLVGVVGFDVGSVVGDVGCVVLGPLLDESDGAGAVDVGACDVEVPGAEAVAEPDGTGGSADVGTVAEPVGVAAPGIVVRNGDPPADGKPGRRGRVTAEEPDGTAGPLFPRSEAARSFARGALVAQVDVEVG